MLRLEFKEGTSSKFWEIAQDGAKYTVRWGRIGTAGQEKLFSFPSSLKAKSEADKLVTEKKKKGYKPVASKGGANKPAPEIAVPRNPALEKLITKSPDDVDNYLVYADWLSANGDARGELITIQTQLDALTPEERKGPKGKPLVKREAEILRDNANFMPGVSRKVVKITWRWGFVDSMRLHSDDWEEELDVVGLVKPLLAWPVFAALTHLRIGVVRWDYVAKDIATILEVVGASPAGPGLRSLTIGDLKGEDVDTGMYDPGKLDKISKQFPSLEKLVIHGNEFALGVLDLPNLRELSIETCGLSKKHLASVLSAKWPKLEALSLWFGSADYGASCKVKDVAPLLDGSAFPNVKHLGLMNAEFTDALCKELPGSKILKRLETLDLSLGTMSSDGAKTILDNKASFAHLKALDVSENFLSKKDIAALKSIGPVLAAKEQKEDDDSVEGETHRYVSIAE